MGPFDGVFHASVRAEDASLHTCLDTLHTPINEVLMISRSFAVHGAASRNRSLLNTPLVRIAFAVVIGAAGASVFVYLRLPLPWFLGALAATMLAAILDWPMTPPKQLGTLLRAVLGVAIGGAFTPELLARGAPILVSVAFIIPWLALLIGLGTGFFMRFAALDRMTAFLAAVPGGMSDMVLLAEEMGANARAVTLIQLARNVLVVFALPLYLQWHNGMSAGQQAFAAKSHLADLTPGGTLELIILGIAGTWIASRLGLAGAAIVGPMVLSGIAHAAGLTVASVPFEIMTPTQVLLGILLGAQFRGLTWLEFRTTLAAGLAFTLALLVLTPLFASLVARVSGLSPVLTVMGFAPGGQAEINILAFALHVDVAFVALHHLARVALVMLAAQAMTRWSKSAAG